MISCDFILSNFLSILQDCLQPLSMQALPAAPESVCIIEIGGGEDETGKQRASGGLILNIGLQVFYKNHILKRPRKMLYTTRILHISDVVSQEKGTVSFFPAECGRLFTSQNLV